MQRLTPQDSIVTPDEQDLSRNWELNRALIETALEKSPTGGNAKPFSWSWQGHSLQVRHHNQLAEHYLNRNQHTSLIALGCLIASVEIAAQFQGFEIETQVSIQDLSAQLKFVNSDQAVRGLAEYPALLRRRTFRGEFVASPKPVLSAMKPSSQVQVHVAGSQEISDQMKSFLTAADTYLWLQNQATRDFLKEIHFTDSLQTKEDRGIRVVDLGVGKMDQMLLRFFGQMPWLPTLFAHIPGLNSSFRAASQRSQKNSHYVLMTSQDLHPESLIKVGHQALLTWLELEKQGYKVQPISMASIPLVDAATGFLPADTSIDFLKLFSEIGPEAIKNQFNLGPGESPVWLLRAGI